MSRCVIETLTVRNWCLTVVPHLLRHRRHDGNERIWCAVVRGTRWAMGIARLTGRLLGMRVQPLRFRALDLRDEQGLLIRLRIAYDDLADVQRDIFEQPELHGWCRLATDHDSVQVYVAKNVASLGVTQPGTMGRALLLVHCCRWWARDASHEMAQTTLLFLDRRPWFEAYERYAARFGVRAIPLAPSGDRSLRGWLKQWIDPASWQVVRAVRDTVAVWWMRKRRQGQQPMQRPLPLRRQPGPRIAVEYYGQLNLDAPERYSDLFFWQQSSLPASELLVLFGLSRDPLDARRWNELAAHGLDAIAMSPAATTCPDAPIWIPRGRRAEPLVAPRWPAGRKLEARWLAQQLQGFVAQRVFWEEFFAASGVKLYVSWFKYDASHCAISDALRRLGGIAVIYQRAYESHPSTETTIATDIVFGFSPQMADVERLAGSSIPYHVATGYLGDHRVPLLKARAQRVREQLLAHGARRILAFSDENSHDDEQWALGHHVTRQSHAFLLEKVLAEPWCGLILKPKVPSTLRRRLGPVAGLLAQAEATGRCFVYEDGALHGAFPPVVAALAADLMVHGHLCAATAGLESALAGVPTLLVDREGWAVSPLYRLGRGRVVFTEWDTLWQSCLEHWASPKGTPGFGDWSPILEELDPFRDGRAAERMGTYLQWLLEGLKAGKLRETVMAEAAERYATQWGKDKVTQIRPDRQWPLELGGPEVVARTPVTEQLVGDRAHVA